MMKSRYVGVSLTEIAVLFFVAEPELLQKTQRITVPTADVEIASHVMMIELGEKAHEVMDDVAPR